MPMSAYRSHARPFNMGQEQSGLAQQSINDSAAMPRTVSGNTIQDRDPHNDVATENSRRDRSRSPAVSRESSFSVSRDRSAQSPSFGIRRRSPPAVFHNNTNSPVASPGSVRHRFVRDNNERFSTTGDRYRPHTSSPRSPVSSFASQPNLLRYPPLAVDWSLENAYRRPRVSEDAHLLREVGTTGPHGSNSRDRNNSVGRLIDFEGFKDVPRGPRSTVSSQDKPRDIEGDKQSPHIFISARDLPVLVKLEKHLQGLLKSLGPRRILRDHTGWYLIYENTPTGREALERCHREYHTHFLFNEYKLNMKKFPRGVSGQVGGNGKPGVTSSIKDQQLVSPSHAPPSLGLNHFKDRESSHPYSIREKEIATNGSPRLEEHDSSIRGSDSQSQHRCTPMQQMERRGTHDLPSSQLSLRYERDDTASLASAVTRSDSVRQSTRDACHVCKQKPVPGFPDLVQCSTCNRKYHGRCHKEPPIPASLSDNHTWSCRRCVRKRINSTAVPFSDIAPFRSESHTSALQIRAEGLRGSSNDVLSAGGDVPATDMPKPSASDVMFDSKMQSIEPNQELMPAVPSIVDEEVESLSDTDLLVARSFAAAEEMVKAKGNASKSGRLRYTRTKVPPPLSKSFDQIRQPQPENLKEEDATNGQYREYIRQQQPENSKKRYVANGQSREHTPQTVNNKQVSARSSAADLRAYAQRRHQSEISKSIEPNSLGPQNQVDGAKSTDEPKSDRMGSSAKISSRSSSAKGGPPAQIAPHAGSQLEVPESPEESRKGGEENLNASEELQLPSAKRDTRERLSSGTLNSASGASLATRSGPARGPRGPRTMECQECGKKIAQVPSGNNKFCTLCKKKEGAPTKAGTTETTPSPSDSIHMRHPPADGAQSLSDLPYDADSLSIRKSNTASNVMKPGNIITLAPRPSHSIAVREEQEPRAQASGTDDTPAASMEATEDFPPPQTPSAPSKEVSPEKLEKIRNLMGDSFKRPTYRRVVLVGMALRSAPDNRMQAPDVIAWIDSNIPTYNLGEGTWYSRIISMLTQGRVEANGKGYWRETEWKEGDGGTPDKRWYQLLPEKVPELWKWDPARMEHILPERPTGALAEAMHSAAQAETESVDNRLSVANMQPAAEKRARTPEGDRMDMDEDHTAINLLIGGVNASELPNDGDTAAGTLKPATLSSDDEPLSKRRRRNEQLSNIGHVNLPQQTPSGTDLQRAQPAVQRPANPSTAPTRGKKDGSFIRSTAPKRPGLVTLSVQGLRKFSGLDLFFDNNQRKRERTAKSFFDEWPEYRSEESFDPEKKLAEIRKRPTRKEMFGKPASHSRLGRHEHRTSTPMIPTMASPEKRSNMSFDVNNPYPWENPNVDTTRKEFTSLEEFWDFPANMLPIISDGQLAYRDGTRNDDGRLPRAREIFKP